MLELIVFKNNICVVVYSPDYGWVLHRSLCIDRGYGNVQISHVSFHFRVDSRDIHRMIEAEFLREDLGEDVVIPA